MPFTCSSAHTCSLACPPLLDPSLPLPHPFLPPPPSQRGLTLLARLELTESHLLLFPKCWDCRHVPDSQVAFEQVVVVMCINRSGCFSVIPSGHTRVEDRIGQEVWNS